MGGCAGATFLALSVGLEMSSLHLLPSKAPILGMNMSFTYVKCLPRYL